MTPTKLKSRRGKPPQKSMSRRRQSDCARYYEYGFCLKSDICAYRHEPRAFGSTYVCPEWQQGNCSIHRCPYRHAPLELHHLEPDHKNPDGGWSRWEKRRDCSLVFSRRFAIEDNSSNDRIVKLVKSEGDFKDGNLKITVKVDLGGSKSDEDEEMDIPQED